MVEEKDTIKEVKKRQPRKPSNNQSKPKVAKKEEQAKVEEPITIEEKVVVEKPQTIIGEEIEPEAEIVKEETPKVEIKEVEVPKETKIANVDNEDIQPLQTLTKEQKENNIRKSRRIDMNLNMAWNGTQIGDCWHAI